MLLGPLTTTWTPPPACTTWASDTRDAFNGIFVQYRTCSAGLPEEAAVPCWPSATTTPPPGSSLGGFGYFSPGLYCPSGYTSACTQAILSGGGPSPMTSGVSFSFQFPPSPGETAIGCCPMGMVCVTDYFHHQTCSTDVFNLETIVTAGTCNSNTAAAFASVGVVTARTAQFFAPLIQINHQSSDLAGSATSATATTATTMSTTTAAAQVSPTGAITSSTSVPQSSSSNGPSTNTIGAGVGIGIGIAVFLVLCALGFWFFFTRRRNRRNGGHIAGPIPSAEIDSNLAYRDRKIGLQPISQHGVEIDGNPMYMKQ